VRRFALVCGSVAVGVAAGPAAAMNTGPGPAGGGPPVASFGPNDNSAFVLHCNALFGSGNAVINKNGEHDHCSFSG
jgi:hypothetical protein